MSHKRSRTNFETDHPHAPFATFGTPLPDEAEARDDGSYVPVWKQEVRDERGRKRLHGAFTGGFSAGYFNTVGSKEGWTPSTFVSSRSNKRKDETTKNQRRAEDYMDEEDLADAAEAQKLETSHAFAGLGASNGDSQANGALMGLLRAKGDTMGLKLLRRMGWRDGQGIGPKVRRNARLDANNSSETTAGESFMFAPDNAPMIQFHRKTDRKGLGHLGETKLSAPALGDKWADEEEDDWPPNETSLLSLRRSKPKTSRTGIGVGILNNDGSDEEDPYEIGPKIRYNRVIGGDKKKKARKATVINTNLRLPKAPVFLPMTARNGSNLRRCHDGKLPLDGFALAKITEDMAALFSQYAPPPVPEGWVPKERDGTKDRSEGFVSAADAAKASIHDPKSRAAILGEKALPGKSVFDFISSSTRDKLATASGNARLPQGRGEIPEEFRLSEEEKQKQLWDRVPKLDQETAVAAIARGSTGPYADDEAKRERYRVYLEHQANPARPQPGKPSGMSDDVFFREITEFFNCARIFKPMTGFMASRFTTAKKSTSMLPSNAPAEMELLTKPEVKPGDPAEEAAKLGMFGTMTRSVQHFYPTRLLCKRFNVKPPAHSMPAGDGEVPSQSQGPMPRPMDTAASVPQITSQQLSLPAPPVPEVVVVNPEKNDAVEGTAAQAEVLRAIFGDSDSE